MIYLLVEDVEGLLVCFFCGVLMSGLFNFKFYFYFYSGKGIYDGGFFFFFLLL